MNDPRYPIGEWTMPESISDSEIADLTERIQTLPSRMRAAVQPLDEQTLSLRYRPEGWTLRQVVHHVPESHMNGFVRWKWALTEDNPEIKTYDEAAWAETAEIGDLAIETSLATLDAIHAKWVAVIRSLSPAKLRDVTFRHPEWGTTSLATMLSLYGWHGDHHLAHITTTTRALD